MTWNAGAVKPTTLRQTDQDRKFFRDLLSPENPPDILVFGFQELVDLENKKITAKSFFKKKKHKETTENEHMSHQYRAWRDHLIRVLDEFSPKENYILLHTANLVGLFTCVFVKASERANIRDVCAAEIKLGFSGRVGNKGALIIRFFIDDSSLCFINCHLAAGQTQTVHRNNDAASIMEAAPLPKNRSPADCANFFVGGGDGSMILDHEICVLNGDLNYRIDAMPRNTIIDAVKQGNLGKLLDRDQLLLSRKRNPGLRLRAFTEMPITFAPTYNMMSAQTTTTLLRNSDRPPGATDCCIVGLVGSSSSIIEDMTVLKCQIIGLSAADSSSGSRQSTPKNRTPQGIRLR